MGTFHVDARCDGGCMDGVVVGENACSDASWVYGSGETAASLVEEDMGVSD